MYREDNVVRISLKPSPSLVYNNLCALGPAGLAYIHTRSGAAVQGIPDEDGAKVDARKVDTQGHSMVQSASACTVDGSTLLVLGNEAGLQVWDETGTNLLYVWKLPKSEPPSAQHADFVRGISFNVSQGGAVQLYVGCSNGNIQVFSVSPGPLIKPTCTLTLHKHPIVALSSAYQSRRGEWSDDLGCELVSCDDAGRICIWEAQGDDGSSYTCVQTIEGGVPCCSLAVRKGFVVAARTDGCVRMYGLKDGRLRSEIVAHSRWLSAMDIHPTRDLIATAAQDCTLGVWSLPIAGGKASCLLSVCKYNEVMTGVAFCGQGADSVAAVAYDVDALNVWRWD